MVVCKYFSDVRCSFSLRTEMSNSDDDACADYDVHQWYVDNLDQMIAFD